MPVPESLSSLLRRAVSAVVAVVSLVTAVAGCSLARTADPEQTTGRLSMSAAATPATRATPANADVSNRLVLRFDGHVATAILDDSAAAREFAAMLPLTLDLSDPMGQAKSGSLPRFRSLDVTGADRTFEARVGELAYWSPGSTVAVVYDDLGQRVPNPGLVRLGVIDTGLDEVAAAGNGFTVRIDLAAGSGP